MTTNTIPVTEIIKVVEAYTARGWVIHPLSSPKDNGNSPGKKPLLKDWQKLQATPTDIEKYIQQGCNIGLVCGKNSGVTVIDLDSMMFADDLFKGVESTTLKSQRTEGRGHVCFKYNHALSSQKHSNLGIEILNDRNNAVLPPSIHKSGDTYRWLNPDTPLIEMPEQLIENLNRLFNTEKSYYH